LPLSYNLYCDHSKLNHHISYSFFSLLPLLLPVSSSSLLQNTSNIWQTTWHHIPEDTNLHRYIIIAVEICELISLAEWCVYYLFQSCVVCVQPEQNGRRKPNSVAGKCLKREHSSDYPACIRQSVICVSSKVFAAVTVENVAIQLSHLAVLVS
jgi:hypothetical protein